MKKFKSDSIYFLLSVIIFLAGVGNTTCLQRTLEYAFNEGCNEFCNNTNARLGHIKAAGPNDTLHYIWDFTENPTILIALTSISAKLQINWLNYLENVPNSLNFTEKPMYTFAVAIERLLEFNDINDRARINEIADKDIRELEFKNFQWYHKNMTKFDNLVEFRIEAKNYRDPKSNYTRQGNIKFSMNAFSTLDHAHLIPCMLHSENATQMDVIIDHIEPEKGFSSSRFALELLIVSENPPSEVLNFDTKRKLDDEFTPGVFEIMELSTPLVNSNSAYLQWRPVSYVDSKRDIAHSSEAVSYPVKNATVNNYFNKNSLIYIYYGENMFNLLAQRMNVSFGESGDGFYKATGYATWTFIAGYGFPPDERFSNIVIMIITIGVGLPCLMLLLTGIYICLRRRTVQNNSDLLVR